MNPKLVKGFWRLADPKISLASFASMFLGTCAAAREGDLSVLWLAVTVAGIFAIEVAKNASGEIYDFDSGTDLAVTEADRSPFSGGKRVLVEGLLTRGQTWGIAMAGYLGGMFAGILLLVFREPKVLMLGLVGLACAFFYHAPPLRLSYRGLGEVVVGLCYGPWIAGGTYLVQRGDWPRHVIALGMPLGLLIAAFLWINEFPDYAADKASGKRNSVVRLGRRRASHWFAGLVVSAGLATLLLPWSGVSRGVWIALLAFFPGCLAVRSVLAHPEEMDHLVPAQVKTLLTFVAWAFLAGAGLLVWPQP